MLHIFVMTKSCLISDYSQPTPLGFLSHFSSQISSLGAGFPSITHDDVAQTLAAVEHKLSSKHMRLMCSSAWRSMLAYSGTNTQRLSSKLGSEGATVRRACRLADTTPNWKVNVKLQNKFLLTFFSCLKVARKKEARRSCPPLWAQLASLRRWGRLSCSSNRYKFRIETSINLLGSMVNTRPPCFHRKASSEPTNTTPLKTENMPESQSQLLG